MSANPLDPGWPVAAIDLHQHLWPEALVDRLRARSRTPYLRGWTLFTHGEAPYEIEPAHHDVRLRLHENARDGIGLACLSLSAPLGIESLRGPSAAGLLDAWHEGAAALPSGFRAWASVRREDPDLAGLAAMLEDGLVGVQVPATDVRAPSGWERLGPVLDVAERVGKPVLVHPGPVGADPEAASLPGWWPAVVGYAAQLQAAWWAWHAGLVRDSHPTLRVVFAAGAGLAPVHHERHVARGGTSGPVDPLVHVDTSSYGPQVPARQGVEAD
jgi:predicted TIM-barrel fold metal-dependent hydrolase